MKATVTVYRSGEIHNQYDVVGFQKAVRSAMSVLCHFLSEHVVTEEKDMKVESRYLAHAEWSCTVLYMRDEVFGLNVRRTA
jgi:hypothetical protein